MTYALKSPAQGAASTAPQDGADTREGGARKGCSSPTPAAAVPDVAEVALLCQSLAINAKDAGFPVYANAFRRAAAALSRRVEVGEEALKLAREFVADPDTRAQVKVQLAASGYPGLVEMIDEAVIVSRELLRLDAELRGKP